MRHSIDRAWWIEVAPEHVEAELEWLRLHIYDGVLPRFPQRRVTAHSRWRTEPSNLVAERDDDTGGGLPPLLHGLARR